MCCENVFSQDGEIKNKKQKPRLVLIDDILWDKVLTKKQQESISAYLRKLIKEDDNDSGL